MFSEVQYKDARLKVLFWFQITFVTAAVATIRWCNIFPKFRALVQLELQMLVRCFAILCLQLLRHTKLVQLRTNFSPVFATFQSIILLFFTSFLYTQSCSFRNLINKLQLFIWHILHININMPYLKCMHWKTLNAEKEDAFSKMHIVNVQIF